MGIGLSLWLLYNFNLHVFFITSVIDWLAAGIPAIPPHAIEVVEDVG